MSHFFPGLVVALLVGRGAPVLQDGDIIFHTSRSAQSAAIRSATHSPYSHMGLILYRGGEPYVFEAVVTVRYTPLAAWTRRGVGGRFVVKRLKDAPARLTSAGIGKLKAEARHFEGRPYDPTFEWTDTRIYCSELVWKLYDRALGVQVGPLQRLADFDLTAPAVKAKMRERYGTHVPLQEAVISPGAMFDWEGLVTVAEE